MPGVCLGSTLGLIHVTVVGPKHSRDWLTKISVKYGCSNRILKAQTCQQLWHLTKWGMLGHRARFTFFPLGLCFFLVCMWTLWFTQNLLEHLHGALVLTGRAAEGILNSDLLQGFIICADKQTQENLAFQCSITSWLFERGWRTWVLMNSKWYQGIRTTGQANAVRKIMLLHWC